MAWPNNQPPRMFNAILNDWMVVVIGDEQAIVGTVEADREGRWPDGRLICTSPLRPGQTMAPRTLIFTLNSSYYLAEPLASTAIN